ncbi:MAG: hypothetical protein ACLFPJ_03150 [Candidatus Woesearchaeota archaeon]
MTNLQDIKAGYDFFRRLNLSNKELKDTLQTINSIDHNSFIKKFKQFERGIPAEDEIMAILSWLGNAQLIHRLEQIQTPILSKEKYQVPDLLVSFNINGLEKPFLIEVKSKTNLKANSEEELHTKLNNQKVILSNKYYHKLKKYGELLNLPILIAWKNTFGAWTLVDLDSFCKKETAYHLTLEDSFKNNLLDVLAKNCTIAISKEFRYEMIVSKDSKVKNNEFTGTIQSFNFYHKNISFDINDTLFNIFNYANLIEEQKNNEKEVIFCEKVSEEYSVFLYQVLMFYIFFMKQNNNINFLEIIEKEKWPVTINEVIKDINEGKKIGVIRNIITTKPKIMPTYLK